MGKKWQLKPEADKEFISKFPEINPIVLNLLFNRNLTDEKAIDEFLNPDYSQNILDPFLFNDAKKAVNRVLKAIEKKQKILVYGDYDADGVTSSSVMQIALKKLGADVNVYIPHREKQGYGLNLEIINDFKQQNIDLIITVDCGISNYEEIKLANKLDIDVIITDHHHAPPQIPKAYAILNPSVEKEQYPFKYLAGVGVAYKFIQAIFKTLREQKKDQYYLDIFKDWGGLAGFEKWLLDLVAIGTVADCVSLIGENRILVKYGLIVLSKTRRRGLKELLDLIGIDKNKLSTYSIGFQIAPRINAVGRLNHAIVAQKVLTSEFEQEIVSLTQMLHQVNLERQKTTESIVNELKQQIAEFDDKFLFAFGEEWPVGVVGLVAGRLAEEKRLPAIVMTRNGNEITGSGRSIPEFNIIEALEKYNHFFSRYGGHAQACGFTLTSENIVDDFKKQLKSFALEKLKGKDLTPVLYIDAKIDLSEIDWDLVNYLEKFEPHGEGNSKPIFLLENLKITQIDQIGQEGKHLKIMVSQNGLTVKKMIGFYMGQYYEKIDVNSTLDAVCEININEWNGNREIELKIVDLKF